MNVAREYDPILGELYLAGEKVPAGVYREVRRGQEVLLAGEDVLPASLDGRVACYARIPQPWRHRLSGLVRA